MPASKETVKRLGGLRKSEESEELEKSSSDLSCAGTSRTVREQTRPREPVPYWQSECGRVAVYTGDCREVLAQLGSDQFHAVVTDPPYGLEFMGKEWDAPWKNEGKIEVCDEGMDESHPFRDGSRRVCYGNRRTRKVDATRRRAEEMDDPVKSKYLRHNVEYVRDSRLYQEWFRSCADVILHVARPGAHLLSFGGTRMWHRTACAIEDAGFEVRDTVMWVYGCGFPKSMDVSKAIDRMHGAKGEEVDVRKRSSVRGGVLHRDHTGKGGYGYGQEWGITGPVTEDAKTWQGWGTTLKPAVEPIIVARKPPVGSVAHNVLEYGCGGMNVDGCRVGSDGEPRKSSTGGMSSSNTIYGKYASGNSEPIETTLGRWPANLIHDGSEEVLLAFPDDTARFFYSAKADDSDRPHGRGEGAVIHPTVKPLNLMRYLVRLVCPRGGTVLDPFMGSGSTGCAAVAEGMRFVGVELSQEYADIAVGKLRLALQYAPTAMSGTIP